MSYESPEILFYHVINPEIRINPELFHPCFDWLKTKENKRTSAMPDLGWTKNHHAFAFATILEGSF